MSVYKVVNPGEDEDTLEVDEDAGGLTVHSWCSWTEGMATVRLSSAQVRDLIVALQEWLAKREGMG